MSRIIFILLATLACASAVADERTFLSKAETASLASGKKWTRTFDNGSATTWDLRKDGDAQTNWVSPVNHRVGTANGKWTVDDEGQLCIVWRGSLADQCVRVAKQDEKLVLVDPKSGSSSSLTVE